MTTGVRGSTSTASGTSNVSSLSLSLAACGAQVGDVAAVCANIGAGTAVTMTGPSGWTQQAYQVQTGGATFQLGIFTKTLTSGDISTDTVTVTGSAGRQMSASLLVVDGAMYDTISTVANDTSLASSIALPTITPDSDNCLIASFASGAAGTSNTAVTYTAPSGWTLQTSAGTSSTGLRNSSAIFTTQLTGGGGSATAAASYTTSITVRAIVATLSFAPVTTTAEGAVAGTFNFTGRMFGPMRSVSTMPVPAYAAHQGGAGEAPPETMTAFNLTLPGKPWLAADCDCFLDASGSIVMWHDTTTDGTTLVTSYTDAAWATVTVPWPSGHTGTPNPAPASWWYQLADTWGGQRILMPELKDSSEVDAPLLNDIAARGITDSVIVQCFSLSRAEAAATAGFHAMYEIVVGDLPSVDWAAVAASGVEFVAFNYTAATSTYVNDAHTAGLKVWVFTISNTTDRDSMLALGVDGMWTDVPSTVAVAPYIPNGIGAGAVAWTGAASGTNVHSGSAAGGVAWHGSASGTATHNGSTAGATHWTGAASGTATHAGASTGSIHWTASVSGVAHHNGATAGGTHWTGSTHGSSTYLGTGSGHIAWVGAVSGFAPVVGANQGRATGLIVWTASVTGSHASTGSSTSQVHWAASATGHATHAGSSSAAISWTGHASGTAPIVGGKSGTAAGMLTWTGSVTGGRASSGHVAGSVMWTGTLSGRNQTGRDLTLSYSTDTDRWTASTGTDRWTASTGTDRWSATTEEA